MDLYIQAHTGFYSDGNLIRDKKLTRRTYLRIPQFVSSLDEFYAKYFVVLKLLKVLAFTVFLAHVQACIRFNFHHYKEESVAHSHALHSQYLASMFWSVGIMTGLFEGELPHHSIEFLFTILVALCGFSMFTTLCATIFVISKCESGQTEAMEARISQLVHVLSFHRVPEDQQTQAIEYLKRYYTDTESHDRETCKLLCPSIANDIQVELWKATIADISIFEGCTDQFIVAMTSLLEMVAFPAQATLFSTGDHGDAMYVVHSGVLAININSAMVREIRKGSCFGELSVFSSMPRFTANEFYRDIQNALP
ncbi:Cyclic nucleotide-binding domain [Phytophthora infestans]|uniref:Cyclic nucleotide-binding domain n=1 Tax=Phytophthora infestans TaxID=4787 RepID=A0A833TH38_PHYIN|nr:Cyclic nucleotide-binding domain [Phytophthora infestans]